MKLQNLPNRLSVLRPVAQVATVSDSWRAGKSSTQRGYGYKWQQYRIRFLFAHPLCVYCEREGKVTTATVVDHIKPHEGDMKLFWNPENHQSLCASCHSVLSKERKGQMPIHDKTINQRVVTSTLIGSEIDDLITKHVAQQAGIDLNEKGVTARAYITLEVGSTGSFYAAKCEIVQDLYMQPRCAEQSK